MYRIRLKCGWLYIEAEEDAKAIDESACQNAKPEIAAEQQAGRSEDRSGDVGVDHPQPSKVVVVGSEIKRRQ